ncbi:MAG: GntR family transcriptional regulator, partial [Fimbriimonadaceae bacterium]|nr:GntR family transcriptional regulator [Alphaproteobacteria bacterium]
MSKSSVETIAMSISEAVRLGRLVPGQRLVEADYTKNYQVSRGTVREAFARLVSDGLLHFERHRGVRVRLLTRKQVADLFKVRESLECLAVELAFPSLNAMPQPMFDLLAEMDEVKDANDLPGYLQLNGEFHDLFYAAADNEMLTRLIAKITGSIHALQHRALLEVAGLTDNHKDHHDMAKAVVDNDFETAAAVT